jgi:hypothetical protein
VLWLYIPDWARNGNIASINEVPTRYSQDEVLWSQDPHCSGHRISDKPCQLRVEEMEMVSFRPEECQTGQKVLCGELQVFARFNVRQKKRSEARDSFLTTIFTCIIMCIGSIMFSADTERIVI